MRARRAQDAHDRVGRGGDAGRHRVGQLVRPPEPGLVDRRTHGAGEGAFALAAETFHRLDRRRLQRAAQPGAERLVPREHHEGQRAARARGGGQERGDASGVVLDDLGVAHRGGRHGGRASRQGAPQLREPLALGRHGPHDLDPEGAAERPRVEANAAVAGLVHHVEVEDHGQLQFGHLQRDQEGAGEVLRIGHLEDRQGPLREEDVPGHLLVLAHGDDAVDAGGVDALQTPAVNHGVPPGHLHRRARIVGDRGVRSRQEAENDALAHVRGPDERDAFLGAFSGRVARVYFHGCFPCGRGLQASGASPRRAAYC